MEAEAEPVRLGDFLEKNRCKIFIKCSETEQFEPAFDSLRIVSSAVSSDKSNSLMSGSGMSSSNRYLLQLAVFRRGDFARCPQLFELSLRKERRAWLLAWILGEDRRFLARLNADKAIVQGALMHRGFWVTAREDFAMLDRMGHRSVPKWDNLRPLVGPMLRKPPERLLSICLAWQPRTLEFPGKEKPVAKEGDA
ncbi:hypothetical protein BOX15_Mlig017119g2 [Macrostomum lignano]|uniref:Uncharacterized protein n=1 Tax=Macrostomum lignano TaxID=282301 RepID=A0A267E9E3_9PLAT|nr:hypothetical protein BOX15_Mlig017119g2 [Macrostomum lignano]